jgi:hypothetical protein
MRIKKLPRRQRSPIERVGYINELKSICDCRLCVRQAASADVSRGERYAIATNSGRVSTGALERLDGLRGVARNQKGEAGGFPIDGGKFGVEFRL